ncbi:tetratricopeptide repeat protein [bacterium]|nr:tetratricopeptide repeat protein [bacterium]
MKITSFFGLFIPLLVLLVLVPKDGFSAKDPDLEAMKKAAESQKWETVVEKAQAVLSRDEKSLEAHRLLGQALIVVGDTVEAIQHLESALSLKPHDTESLVPLVDALLARGEIGAADQYVAAAEAKDKKGRSWEIKASRARVLASQGQIPEATRMLAEAAAKNPKNALYPILLARLYRDKNIYELAIDHFRHAVELAPTDAQLRFELAQTLIKNKQFDEGLGEFKKVLDADPTNIEVNYQIGRLYFAAGRYTDALTYLQGAVKDRPEHFYSHYLLGQSYRNLIQLEEAEASLLSAHKLRPQRRDVTLLLTKTLKDERKYSVEIGFLRTVLPDTTKDAELLELAGDAYYALGAQDSVKEQKMVHYDSAAVFYKRSLNADPEQSRLTYRVATVYYNLDELDSAIVFYKKTLELQPDKCGAMITMGYSYGRLQKWVEAVSALRRGAACDLTNVAARSYLASILAARDSTSAAIKVYEEITRLDSANCEAYGQMGLIYFNREQYVPAIRNLKQAVTYCPERGDFWSLYGYANWSHFLNIRGQIRDSHDGLIPGDELLEKGGAYLRGAETGFEKALRYNPGDKDLKETYEAVKEYKKRIGG